MYYTWSVSADYPESYWFKYDHANSPDYLSFKEGKRIEVLPSKPVFRLKVKISAARLQTFDYFLSDGPDFISPRFVEVIRKVAPDDIQLIDAEVWANEERIEGCKVVNVLHIVRCIDMHKSVYTPQLRSMPDGPFVFSKFEFLPGCLGTHLVARAQEDEETIVVSEPFVSACKGAEIKGVEFLPNGERSY